MGKATKDADLKLGKSKRSKTSKVNGEAFVNVTNSLWSIKEALPKIVRTGLSFSSSAEREVLWKFWIRQKQGYFEVQLCIVCPWKASHNHFLKRICCFIFLKITSSVTITLLLIITLGICSKFQILQVPGGQLNIPSKCRHVHWKWNLKRNSENDWQSLPMGSQGTDIRHCSKDFLPRYFIKVSTPSFKQLEPFCQLLFTLLISYERKQWETKRMSAKSCNSQNFSFSESKQQ